MSKERFQRTKYLRIMEILQQESDADRPISTNDLIAKLGKFGISIDRRTLYEDIVVLNELGYEVFCKKGRANNYYVVDRKFDVPELRILMDAVESASFITDKKTKELLDKIASLGGSYRAELLQRNRKTFDIRKHTNESIYYSVSSIDDAILHSKQISFQYFDFGINGERVFRNEGRRYVVSPLSTAFVDNNYYLVAYYKKYNSNSSFRIDRMYKTEEEPLSIESNVLIESFNINKHRKETFGMFTGETAIVTIEFDKSLIDVIFDRFGEKISINSKTEDIYTTEVEVQLSPVFYGWCGSFGNLLRLVSPKKAVIAIKNRLKEVAENYKLDLIC